MQGERTFSSPETFLLRALSFACPAVPRLFQDLCFCGGGGGLLRARSRLPEIVENIKNVTEGMERLDGAVELAKQVLTFSPMISHSQFF